MKEVSNDSENWRVRYCTKSINAFDTLKFAELVRNFRPVHVDEELAKKTLLCRSVAYGMGAA